MSEDPPDTDVVDEPSVAEGSGEIALDKRPTKPIEKLKKGAKGLSIKLDLADPKAVSDFLRAVADVIEHKRSIELIFPVDD